MTNFEDAHPRPARSYHPYGSCPAVLQSPGRKQELRRK